MSRYSHHFVDHIIESPVWTCRDSRAVYDMPAPPRGTVSYDSAESLTVEELIDAADTESDLVSRCSSVPVWVNELSHSISLLRLTARAAGSGCRRIVVRVCTKHRLCLTEEVNRAAVETVDAISDWQ